MRRKDINYFPNSVESNLATNKRRLCKPINVL